VAVLYTVVQHNNNIVSEYRVIFELSGVLPQFFFSFSTPDEPASGKYQQATTNNQQPTTKHAVIITSPIEHKEPSIKRRAFMEGSGLVIVCLRVQVEGFIPI
jgi:hypothetical protein